jgi:hypothetical protein
MAGRAVGAMKGARRLGRSCLELSNDADISCCDNAGGPYSACLHFTSLHFTSLPRPCNSIAEAGRHPLRWCGRHAGATTCCETAPRNLGTCTAMHASTAAAPSSLDPATHTMNMQPKSILKKTAVSAEPPRGTKPVNERHLNVALHHANILEERKRVEAAVLDSIMTLMDYPAAPDADAKRPTATDAQHFRDALVSFQAADYDALIEERNIADKCGYALCPRPKKKARSTARKQFVDTSHGVEIVDRKVLEVWCSDDCAKRALYVKVQLSEEPAWARQGSYADTIELMVENPEELKTLPLRLKKEAATPAPADEAEAEDDVAAAWTAHEDAMDSLALERGEMPGQLIKATNSLVQDQITERMPSAPPLPPSHDMQISEHTMAIEGHVPRTDRRERDEDEDDPQDWDRSLG